MQNLIYIGIGLVVIGAAAWYFVQPTADTSDAVSDRGAAAVETDQEAVSQLSDSDLTGMGSFVSLMGLGSSVRCEFTSTSEGQSTEGVFYTDGERFRVNAVAQAEMSTFDSNIINDGAFTYVWGSSPEGAMAMKMSNETNTDVDVPEAAGYSYTQTQSEQFDVEKEVQYDCDWWDVDESLFVPPADIDFMDMQAMMQNMMEGMPEGFEAQMRMQAQQDAKDRRVAEIKAAGEMKRQVIERTRQQQVALDERRRNQILSADAERQRREAHRDGEAAAAQPKVDAQRARAHAARCDVARERDQRAERRAAGWPGGRGEPHARAEV